MINVENISKSFGGQVLFDEAGFRLNQRERAGLVGRNGHGKTTLFRMITGEDVPDEGQIVIPKNYRIGVVRQHIDFKEATVLKEGMRGLPEGEKDHHWKVERILSGLGFSMPDMDRDPHEFSGGYQVRLNLAKLLVSEPDLLLLDEPTNYLDITSIRWIQQFLRSWPRELLLITHDRGFMDEVITHTIGINRQKIRKIQGDTGKYYTQIAQDEEIYEKTRVNDERKRKEIEQFITRFRAKARLANMVQSRVKTLAKMEKKEKLADVKNLSFSFRTKPFESRQVMSVSDLAFGYDDGPSLIKDLSFTVSPRDRICIIGKNGTGKTTLIKLLAEALTPRGGQVSFNPNIAKGFYEQTNVRTLVDSRTVLEEILYVDEGVDLQMARDIAGAMMFQGDDALKKIEVLSGGEKSRVMLGKLLADPVNLLLLDEPSNHLDMESCDSLLAAIDNFDGVVIMVTHNEMFLHSIARRLIVFQEDETYMFEGNYAHFLEKEGWRGEDITAKADRTDPAPDDTITEKLSKKELRRRRSDIITERGKLLKPIEKRISAAEDEIDTREKELDALNAEMQTASENQAGARITELSQAIHACQSIIDEQFDELERLTAESEEKGAAFDEKLRELDAMAEV